MNRDMFNPHRSLRFGRLRGRDMQGNMDYYMFQRRYENESNDYDPDEYLWQYFRDELRSQRGDNDYPLESENRPYNNYARQRLLWQHTGSTTGKTPLIYDGDWTYHDMIKDPRGWTNEPRYQEMRRIDENRYWNMPFADSAKKDLGDIQDPYDREEAIKWWYDYMRGTHYTAFGTSEENIVKGTPPGNINSQTLAEKIAHQIARTGEDTMYHKSTTNLSNDMTQAGHRSVPGHKFNVPRYGMIYAMAPLSDRKTAMKLTKFENIFGNTKLMNTISRSLRKLSKQRSILLDYISDSIRPDSKGNVNKKSAQLVADMLALMGFSVNDLTDTTKQNVVKGNKKPDMPVDVKKFVENLYDMPDSKKMEINGSIIMHLTNALSDIRKGTYNLQNTHPISQVKEYMSTSRPLHELKSKVNDVLIKLKDNSKLSNINKTIVDKIEAGLNKNVSILLKDSTKTVPKYNNTKLSEAKRLDSEIDLVDNVMKMMPKRLRELTDERKKPAEIDIMHGPDILSRNMVKPSNIKVSPYQRPEREQEIKEIDW